MERRWRGDGEEMERRWREDGEKETKTKAPTKASKTLQFIQNKKKGMKTKASKGTFKKCQNKTQNSISSHDQTQQEDNIIISGSTTKASNKWTPIDIEHKTCKYLCIVWCCDFKRSHQSGRFCCKMECIRCQAQGNPHATPSDMQVAHRTQREHAGLTNKLRWVS
jgi:hypothetical protein